MRSPVVYGAALVLLLSGCAAAVPRPAENRPATRAPAPRAAPPQRPGFRPATPLAAPGLDRVIGAGPGQLVRLFGAPRLDIVEGDARKLQFVGPACVLDAYLYPPAPGREPAATYVDARRDDGHEVDRAGCVAELTRR